MVKNFVFCLFVNNIWYLISWILWSENYFVCFFVFLYHTKIPFAQRKFDILSFQVMWTICADYFQLSMLNFLQIDPTYNNRFNVKVSVKNRIKRHNLKSNKCASSLKSNVFCNYWLFHKRECKVKFMIKSVCNYVF